eukprot:1177724-Prorocentrum_minimum.AAC.3
MSRHIGCLKQVTLTFKIHETRFRFRRVAKKQEGKKLLFSRNEVCRTFLRRRQGTSSTLAVPWKVLVLQSFVVTWRHAVGRAGSP